MIFPNLKKKSLKYSILTKMVIAEFLYKLDKLIVMLRKVKSSHWSIMQSEPSVRT